MYFILINLLISSQVGDQTRALDQRQKSLKSPAQERGRYFHEHQHQYWKYCHCTESQLFLCPPYFLLVSSSLSEPPTANIRPTPSTPSPSSKPSPSAGSKATPRASIRPMVTPAPVSIPTPTATVMPTTQTDSQEGESQGRGGDVEGGASLGAWWCRPIHLEGDNSIHYNESRISDLLQFLCVGVC